MSFIYIYISYMDMCLLFYFNDGILVVHVVPSRVWDVAQRLLRLIHTSHAVLMPRICHAVP
jgi:hypothetical protein